MFGNTQVNKGKRENVETQRAELYLAREYVARLGQKMTKMRFYRNE